MLFLSLSLLVLTGTKHSCSKGSTNMTTLHQII